MEDGSAYWTAIGAVAVAIIGIIGNKWAKSNEITQGTNAELEKAHESRPWAEMGRRLDDLNQENKEIKQENDRLRDERDALRLQVVDWQIEAHKADALREQCERERVAHDQVVERLSAEIRRLRGEGFRSRCRSSRCMRSPSI